MRAWVLNQVGDFQLKEVDKPRLAIGQVLVNVKAAGVCGSDIPRVYKNGAHKMPLILGHEFSGEVVCAPGAKKHWLSKRVGIFPLIPCMKCQQCQNRQYELCRNYDYLGSRSDGGFADFVAVPGTNLIELPDNVSYEAAAMLEPMSVAVHAMRRVVIEDNSKIIISGLGTIGLLLLSFLLDLYSKDNIYVIGNKNFQKNLIIGLGLDESHYYDFKNVSSSNNNMAADSLAPLNWIKDNIENGPDIYFECVGKSESISLGIKVTAPSGQICLIGNPYGNVEFDKDTYWKILRNQLRITGSWNSSFLRDKKDDWNYALNAVSMGKICPEKLISHRFNMEELDKAFKIMKDKKENYIKLMMLN